MFVRFLTGRRKGEIEEMKFVDAQAVIADGRAERAFADDSTKVNVPTAAPAPARKTGKEKARRDR